MARICDRWRDRLGGRQLFASARSRRRFATHLLVALTLFVLVTVLVHRYVGVLTDQAALRAFIRQYGLLSPLVFVLLQALQVVVAPIPGQILAVVAGYLFGAWWGTLYNMIGITIGSTVAFWLSRRFGRPYVERIIHDDALATFDRLGDSYGRPTILAFFVIPGLPDDLLCFAGGLTTIPLWQLVVLAVVGRTPGFFLANLVGDFLGTEQYLAALTLAVILMVVSLVAYLRRERLLELLQNINNKD